MQLDRELVAEYRLNISIQNGDQMDVAHALITVLDTNDNRPKFVFSADEQKVVGGGGGGTYFAVLPIETASGQSFFAISVGFFGWAGRWRGGY